MFLLSLAPPPKKGQNVETHVFHWTNVSKREVEVAAYNLGEVERVREVGQGVAGVGQAEVKRRLLQHLLVSVLMVLAVACEAAAQAPILRDRHLQRHRSSRWLHSTFDFFRYLTPPHPHEKVQFVKEPLLHAETHRPQRGERRPRLEAVLGGEARSGEGAPVPAVGRVAVEVRVAVARVVRIARHVALPLRLGAVCRTGDQERTTGIFLRDA